MTDRSDPEPSAKAVNMPASSAPDAGESYSPRILLREKTDEERRESTRREYFVGVHIATEREAAFGLSGNISSGGIFVVAEDPPSLGSRVELEFLLDDATSLRVEGEVRWVRRQWDQQERRPPGFGVEFDDLDAAQRDQLAELLEALDA